VGAALTGKVGFRLEDGADQRSPEKGQQLDSMLGAIENGETDGVQGIANLRDLSS
jgi:hypothetical protein